MRGAASFSLTVPALPVLWASGLPGSSGDSPVWEGAGALGRARPHAMSPVCFFREESFCSVS